MAILILIGHLFIQKIGVQGVFVVEKYVSN